MFALTVCRKAGKLIAGLKPAERAALSGAKAIIISNDLSDRARRSAEMLTEKGAVLIELPFSQHELHFHLGTKFAVAAVNDENMAKLIIQSAEIGG